LYCGGDKRFDGPQAAEQISSVAVLDRYILEALPERKVARFTYLSWIRSQVRPRWGDHPVAHVKPLAVELWIKGSSLSGRSKAMSWSFSQIVHKNLQPIIPPSTTQRTKVIGYEPLLNRACRWRDADGGTSRQPQRDDALPLVLDRLSMKSGKSRPQNHPTIIVSCRLSSHPGII
jgi:hypothetical protein